MFNPQLLPSAKSHREEDNEAKLVSVVLGVQAACDDDLTLNALRAPKEPSEILACEAVRSLTGNWLKSTWLDLLGSALETSRDALDTFCSTTPPERGSELRWFRKTYVPLMTALNTLAKYAQSQEWDEGSLLAMIQRDLLRSLSRASIYSLGATRAEELATILQNSPSDDVMGLDDIALRQEKAIALILSAGISTGVFLLTGNPKLAGIAVAAVVAWRIGVFKNKRDIAWSRVYAEEKRAQIKGDDELFDDLERCHYLIEGLQRRRDKVSAG